MAKRKKKASESQTVIPIWLMIYDGDPSKSYIFCSRDKVLASAESVVRSSCAGRMPDEVIDTICSDIMSKVAADSKPFLMIKCPAMQLVVHRLELDKYNDIHKCLSRCREQVDEPLRKQIDNLFADLST